MLFPPNTGPLGVKADFSFPSSSLPFSLSSICYSHKLGDGSDMKSIFITVGEDLWVTVSRMHWVAEHGSDSPRPCLSSFQSAGARWSSGQPPSSLGIDLSFTLRSLDL